MMVTSNLNTGAEVPIQSGLILAAETSGRMGSVALAQGAELLGQLQFSGPMRHSAEIFPAITSLLKRFGKKAIDIEQVYISVGPGSFTGLRIAVTIAKSFALANQAKIVAVDTLDCIAANVNEKTQDPRPKTQDTMKQNELLAVILDAKRGQFFVAVYENTPAGPLESQRDSEDFVPGIPRIPRGWEKVFPDSLLTADEFLNRFTDKPIALIGEGLVFYKDKFNNPAVSILDEKYWNPSASNIYRLGRLKAHRGEFADPLTLTPNYLRAPDVKVKEI